MRYEHLFIIFAVENNKYLMSPRPKNIRKVNNMPSVAGFKPIASNSSRKDAIFLHFEEYEAIRLCDYEMKTQQEASVSMGYHVRLLAEYIPARVRRLPKHWFVVLL